MFIRFDREEGLANALYRSPEEIVSDIEEIKGKIAEIRERLNFRVLLLEIISDDAVAEQPDLWIDRLEGLVEDARGAERDLALLKEALCDLREELYTTQWALGQI